MAGVLKGGSMGERFFKGVDQGMNADARRKFAEEQAAKGAPAPQIVSPQDRVASSINETRTENVDKTEAEITIKDKTGGRAQVTKSARCRSR